MYATPTYRTGPLLPRERDTLQMTADMLTRQADPAAERLAAALTNIADGASTTRYEPAIAMTRDYMRMTARRSDPEYWLERADSDDYGALGADMIQVWVSENVAVTLQLNTALNLLGTALQRVTQQTPVTV